jgi:hypothetical protein
VPTKRGPIDVDKIHSGDVTVSKELEFKIQRKRQKRMNVKEKTI